MKIYVEGGGNAKDLKVKCRQGFSEFVRKAGLDGRMPAFVACGSRNDAFNDFCVALVNGEEALLLVDSEDAISPKWQSGSDAQKWLPWDHLLARDAWDVSAELAKLAKRHKRKIPQCSNLRAHLMVRCTESWFLADPQTLAKFYGNGFLASQLPKASNSIENISKKNVYTSLTNATRKTKTKGEYGKGAHSFSILSLIAPEKVVGASPWAKRFIDYLGKVC